MRRHQYYPHAYQRAHGERLQYVHMGMARAQQQQLPRLVARPGAGLIGLFRGVHFSGLHRGYCSMGRLARSSL